jgi:hypothetical protein
MAARIFPACDCIARINEQLAERGATQISQGIAFYTNSEGLKGADMAGASVVTFLTSEKKRGEKALSACASFCPFCGKEYVETPISTEEKEVTP